ncbi:MAG: hypothetical protein AB8B79_21345 [Granulosicoccus sp.]
MDLIYSLRRHVKETFQYISTYSSLLPEAGKAIFGFKVDIISLRGQIRGTDETIEILYAGRRLNLPYLKKTFFAPGEVLESHSQSANLLTFRRSMKTSEPAADVVLMDIGWPYHGIINKQGEYLELPDWLNMVVPINDDWESIVKRFRRTTRNNDLRLIRRNQYHCEESNDPEIIRNFYDDFYLPFVTHRHGGDLILSTRKHIEKRAKQGTILQVVGDSGPVAAGVVYPENGVLYFLWTGMPASCIENPPEAAISALSLFCLRYAFDHSFESVDFTGTRALPKDGVFQSKRKWGAIVEDSFSPSSILFKPAANNMKAAVFCEQFPLVARRGNDLELVVCVRVPNFDDSECERVLSRFFCEGIGQVTVVHLSEQCQDANLNARSKHPNVRVISSDLARFTRFYRRDFISDNEQRPGT